MEAQPTLSPRISGPWESLKSVKSDVCTISTNRIFTDQTLQTYLCQVESILNKLPPTPISDDIHDFKAITPNHLLIGHQND